LPFNNKPPKTLSGKGRRGVIKLPSAERRKNNIFVACLLPVEYDKDSVICDIQMF
jgi:hypothetical protein